MRDAMQYAGAVLFAHALAAAASVNSSVMAANIAHRATKPPAPSATVLTDAPAHHNGIYTLKMDLHIYQSFICP